MGENSFVAYLRDGLKKAGCHVVKHHDAFTPAIPDLSVYIGATNRTIWCECKALEWPARAGTKIDVGYRPGQREFLETRSGWLFLRAGRDYLLYSHNLLPPEGKAWVKKSHFNFCCVNWANSINFEELMRLWR